MPHNFEVITKPLYWGQYPESDSRSGTQLLAIYYTRICITLFTKATQWSLSRARGIQSTHYNPVLWAIF